MPRRRLVVPAIIGFVLLWACLALADDAAEIKIKNGKLLTEKAMTSEGDVRADYIYKAKREFERAALTEPDNPWAYYWQAVILYYLEGDSLEADRIYAKALERKEKKFAAAPVPWAYHSNGHLSAAFKGDFDWAGGARAVPEPLPTQKPPKEEPRPDPGEFLSAMMATGDFAKAESLVRGPDGVPSKSERRKTALERLEAQIAPGLALPGLRHPERHSR